jgi:hypothetical protein
VKISFQNPKTELGLQNQKDLQSHQSYPQTRQTDQSIENLKTKISLQSPKTEFGLQNQYGRVTYPSIGHFTWSKKKYTFEGQKGKKKSSEPKNGIWAPKSG